MDDVIYDELLQVIFSKLSSSCSSSLLLVSKRWLHIYRSSRTCLTLKVSTIDGSTGSSLSAFLLQFPFLSSLSIIQSPEPSISVSFTEQLFCAVSSTCPKLTNLRFLAGPLTSSSLDSLPISFSLLHSLTLNLSRPLHLYWVASFSCLKELTLYVVDGVTSPSSGLPTGVFVNEVNDATLGLESVSISGIRRDDLGAGWLWRSCEKLKRLRLISCEGVGDGGSFQSFIHCVKNLQELELRTCRSLVSGLLLKLADNCETLNSLLLYDGGSSESLHSFISNTRSVLTVIDFRLPLDLNNHHLLAAAQRFSGLVSLRLQSCCLVTGEGLKALGMASSSTLEELQLINCDVVGEESGLLASLGQNLKNLKTLDLSYNELLIDKELTSMLVSLNSLAELKLRGCRRITNVATMCMMKNCKWLRKLDIAECSNVGADSIDLLLINLERVVCIHVEDSKLSDAAICLAARKLVRIEA